MLITVKIRILIFAGNVPKERRCQGNARISNVQDVWTELQIIHEVDILKACELMLNKRSLKHNENSL